jgi:hypothetical protein
MCADVLFGFSDLGFDRVGAEIGFAADKVRAQFVRDGFGVIHQRFFVAEGEDADLFGREPERRALKRRRKSL